MQNKRDPASKSCNLIACIIKFRYLDDANILYLGLPAATSGLKVRLPSYTVPRLWTRYDKKTTTTTTTTTETKYTTQTEGFLTKDDVFELENGDGWPRPPEPYSN